MSNTENGLPTIKIANDEMWNHLKQHGEVYIIKIKGEIKPKHKNPHGTDFLDNEFLAESSSHEQKNVIVKYMTELKLCIINSQHWIEELTRAYPIDYPPNVNVKTVVPYDFDILKPYLVDSGFKSIYEWLNALTEEFASCVPNHPKNEAFDLFEVIDIKKALTKNWE
jgi:hypothetical protein